MPTLVLRIPAASTLRQGASHDFEAFAHVGQTRPIRLEFWPRHLDALRPSNEMLKHTPAPRNGCRETNLENCSPNHSPPNKPPEKNNNTRKRVLSGRRPPNSAKLANIRPNVANCRPMLSKFEQHRPKSGQVFADLDDVGGRRAGITTKKALETNARAWFE